MKNWHYFMNTMEKNSTFVVMGVDVFLSKNLESTKIKTRLEKPHTFYKI